MFFFVILIVIYSSCLLISLSLMFFSIIWEPKLYKLFKKIYKDCIKNVFYVESYLTKFWDTTLNTNDEYKILAYKDGEDKLYSIMLDKFGDITMSSFYWIQSNKLSSAVIKKI